MMAFELPEVLRAPGLSEVKRLVIRLTGETGVGKSFSARNIHEKLWSGRPYVSISLAELGEGNLMKSELFGIDRRVVGGVDARPGVFRRASGGTLFLDEFQEAKAEVQVLLLTVLQEQVVDPFGGGEPVTIDVRLIIGSQTPLRVLATQGRLRRDLFQRLRRGPEVALQSLRRLGEARFRALAVEFGSKESLAADDTQKLTDALWAMTVRYPERAWPGNIRELETAIVSRVWLSHDDVLDEVRSLWLQSTPQRGRSTTPVGHWMVGEAQEDDVLLLKALLEAVLGGKAGAAGRKRTAVQHAERVADLLAAKRRRGIPADWLADVLGYKPGKGFEDFVGDLAAAGLVEVVEREKEVRDTRKGEPEDEAHSRRYETTRYLMPVWPLARVDVVVGSGGREQPWSPHLALTAGDVVEIRVQVAFSCDVRVALASHSATERAAIDFDSPTGTITTAPGDFARWNLPITLDAHVGWEQMIVHIQPRIDRKPATERGGSFGAPHTGRRTIEPSALTAQRDVVRARWGAGWMTDFVIRKVQR